MDDRIRRLVERVKIHLISVYGNKIKQVILYGSYARGEATANSDVDVVVVVDDSLNPSEVRKSLSDLLLALILEEGELVSVLALPESFFKDYNSPFILNVKQEGIKV